MKMHPTTVCSLLAASLVCTAISTAGAHDHIAAGVVSTSPGAALALYGSTISGSLNTAQYHMLVEPPGNRYAGYYALDEQPRALFPNDYFTFSALSDGQTQLDGPLHAHTGAYLWMEISYVTGPAGAHFGFWDENESFLRTTPNIQFTTNTPTGNWKFEITQPLSQPAAPGGSISESGGLHYIIPGSAPAFSSFDQNEDPYGHAHDRGFTVDQPGTYHVGFTLYDLGVVGPGGEPLQAPSVTYDFTFIAVPEPHGALLLAIGTAILGLARRRGLMRSAS